MHPNLINIHTETNKTQINGDIVLITLIYVHALMTIRIYIYINKHLFRLCVIHTNEYLMMNYGNSFMYLCPNDVKLNNYLLI